MELLSLIERWWKLIAGVAVAIGFLLRLLFPTRAEFNKLKNRVLWLEAGNPVTDRARKKKLALSVRELDSTQ